jgi:protein involved in polysaccharide export with SLBB domain
LSAERRAEHSGAVPHLLRVPAHLALAGALLGCEVDSYIDPSVIGRWENTPTIVPILERIDVIERDTGEFVDVTPVMAEDLLPEATEYRAGPGDVLTIVIFDFYQAGAQAQFQQLIDPRGFVTLPQIGEVYVNKLTRPEIQTAIAEAIRKAGLLEDAIVDVQIPGARQATFSVFGLISGVGRYAVPGPDYRLLEALTDAGGVSPSIDKVYIIRQVSLSEPAAEPKAGESPTPSTKPAPQRSKPRPSPDEGKSLIDLIDELTEPEGEASAKDPPAKPPTPSADPDLESFLEPEATKPEKPPESRPGALATTRDRAASPAALRQEEEPPPIDLVDQDLRLPPAPPASAPAAGVAVGRWIFLNGEWVQVFKSTEVDSGLPEEPDALDSAPDTEGLVTQRIIEVPVAPLIQGVAKYNLVVRPGDSISVPGPPQGFVYLTGPGVARAGTYQLPFTGKLTLQRLIASAGGLGGLAIPERVDLTRMIGDDRQATIRLNLRAIAEGTQPDFFLKPDDLVNVGTNFWATPLAVIRGGLRASYGFGFLLDRNFGNDVFGAPPSERGF